MSSVSSGLTVKTTCCLANLRDPGPTCQATALFLLSKKMFLCAYLELSFLKRLHQIHPMQCMLPQTIILGGWNWPLLLCFKPTPPTCSVLLLLQTSQEQGTGKVPPGGSPQSGMAGQGSNQLLVPGRIEFGGWQFLSQACSLTLSKWTSSAATFWANFRNHSSLLWTKQIPGELSLDLVNTRSKTERTPVLDRPYRPRFN
jgi:hypothetical protein